MTVEGIEKTARQQVVPGQAMVLNAPMAAFAVRSPSLHADCENVIGALKQDMLPHETQMAIINAMSPAARREMVAKIAGLDASVLMTFKAQIHLVDTVLRRIVGEDGTVLQEDSSLSLKDALNLSLKVTQIMVRDLPKIYSLDRIQRQEEALRRVMESHLTRGQQEALLEELEKIENPDAARLPG
jgi:hypothetical protein